MWWWSLSSDRGTERLLDGRHVLVTGAGGAIGQAVTAAFAAAGASTFGVDLLAGNGVASFDVTDDAAVAAAFAEAE